MALEPDKSHQGWFEVPSSFLTDLREEHSLSAQCSLYECGLPSRDMIMGGECGQMEREASDMTLALDKCHLPHSAPSNPQFRKQTQ